jgi:hypothetical protein
MPFLTDGMHNCRFDTIESTLYSKVIRTFHAAEETACVWHFVTGMPGPPGDWPHPAGNIVDPRVANSTLHIPEAYSRVRVSLCLKEKLH